MPFPKTIDYHKKNKPSVPNCYGIFFALISVCYWYILYLFGIMEKTTLALSSSVLFGSTMGLFDDMADLRWRYKVILPLFASIPYMVLQPSERTTIALLLFGVIDLNFLFFFLLVPIIITVITNVFNQLGGLNGLESISGLVILIGLAIASNELILNLVPLLILIVLFYLSYTGKAFIGNVGTFSIGITLAVYSIIFNLKLMLLISMIPHIFNASLILFSKYFLKEKPDTFLDDDGLLFSLKAGSLRTLLLRYRKMSEHGTVILICLIIVLFTILALILNIFYF